jgi:phenylalanine-4-hydroxylase
MQRSKPLAQQYENYTAEDFKVWRTLFERQTELLNKHASTTYLDALSRIGFQAGTIPKFAEVNEKLMELTGWQVAVVPGHVSPKDFFEMLAYKIFPATCWLRTYAELDYIEEPDMFHDMFGHVPLLVNESYASFLQAFGKCALDRLNDPSVIELMSRIYWFTIEFGIINEGGENKIYGAGILSSPGETRHSTSSDSVKQQFDTKAVLQTGFRTDVLQERYFVIDNYDELANILSKVEQIWDAGNSDAVL